MDEYETRQDQRKFIGETLVLIQDSLPDDEKKMMNSIIDTYLHTAPEIIMNIWDKLFQHVVVNFNEVEGRHYKTVEIYNTRYLEFKKRWYS